jgi:hypothetical protein
MPVTAKFSEEFYAKFGHRVVDELVDWFNKVDATYRSEFRELFDVNFARFDAKLEQRAAELRAELHTEVAGLRGEFTQALTALETRLIRWMLLFWVGTIGTMIALLRFWSG